MHKRKTHEIQLHLEEGAGKQGSSFVQRQRLQKHGEDTMSLYEKIKYIPVVCVRGVCGSEDLGLIVLVD